MYKAADSTLAFKADPPHHTTTLQQVTNGQDCPNYWPMCTFDVTMGHVTAGVNLSYEELCGEILRFELQPNGRFLADFTSDIDELERMVNHILKTQQG